MKGPGMRIDLDVRRVWECPQCGRRRKAQGAVTALRCQCQPDGVQMKLVEGRRQVRKFPYPAADAHLDANPPFAGEVIDTAAVDSAVRAADAATFVEPAIPDPPIEAPPEPAADALPDPQASGDAWGTRSDGSPW